MISNMKKYFRLSGGEGHLVRHCQPVLSQTRWIVAAVALTYCWTLQAAPIVQTAQYYMTHPNERDVVLKRCKQMSTQADKDKDCENARKAQSLIQRPTRAKAGA